MCGLKVVLGNVKPQSVAAGARELVGAGGRKQHAGLGALGGGDLFKDVIAASGVRVDHVAVGIPAALDGGANLVLAGPAAAKYALDLGQQLGGNLVATGLCQLLHKAGNELAVAVGQEVEHALEVGADEDVHRRRNGREERAVAVVDAGGQEVSQHVVLVARDDELGNGQTHALGVVAGQDIAKVAGRHAELHGIAGLDGTGAQQLRIGGKVVDDLRHQAPDVDGVGARKHRTGGL